MNVKIANFVTAKFYKASDGRNGYSSKKMKTDSGILEQNISRDRELEFHPQIVRKCQRRCMVLRKIIALYARGQITRT